MVVGGQTALATLLPEKELWFSLGWSWCGCFEEEIIVLLMPRFLKPKSCRSHYTEYAAPFEGNTNKLRWEVWIRCVRFMSGITGRLL
jgi:hypothetical protein